MTVRKKDVTELRLQNKILKNENSELRKAVKETEALRRQLKEQREMFRKLEKEYETELRNKKELLLPKPKKTKKN